MAVKYNLPNQYVQEQIKYNDLYLKGSSRTSTGNPSWVSSSSGATYTVVNNTGENGLLILIQTAIDSYTVDADDFNGKAEGSALSTHEALKASTSTLAHVKVDGTTIAATNGVISSVGLLNVPACRIRRSTEQSIPNSSYTYIEFDTVTFDTGTIANLGSYPTRLTCQASGFYMILASATFQKNSTGMRAMRFVVNTSNYIDMDSSIFSSSVEPTLLSLSTLYYLNSGDYVRLQVFQDSTVSLNINTAQNWSPEFMMIKIG